MRYPISDVHATLGTDAAVSLASKTATFRSGREDRRDRISSAQPPLSPPWTSTSIMSEKYCPSLAALDSATLPPLSMTFSATSLTIHSRSRPEA
jgi:hypothetical protein